MGIFSRPDVTKFIFTCLCVDTQTERIMTVITLYRLLTIHNERHSRNFIPTKTDSYHLRHHL